MWILAVYLVCVLIGQAFSVALGLLLDPYSKTVAITVFIIVYYSMYWVAWRATLLIFERLTRRGADTSGDGGSRAKIAGWLLAPAVLALDFD